MRLTDRIHLVGGGSWGGTGLSPNPDCHVYLIDGGDSVALVDAGSGVAGSQEAICQEISEAGFSLSDIDTILVTHKHGDHAGGVAGLARVTGATVHSSSETARVLRSADEGASAISVGRDAGLYPSDYSLTPIDDVTPVFDGQSLQIGEIHITAVATPGHCDGHISYVFVDGAYSALFAGDAVFWRGRVLVQPIVDCQPQSIAKSLTRLSEFEDLDGFFPGHGAFTVGQGARHIAAGAQQVASLRMPLSL